MAFVEIDAKIKIKSKKQTVHYSKISFEKGDFVLLGGENGSGKTTFFSFLLKYPENYELDKEYENIYSIHDGVVENVFDSCSDDAGVSALRRRISFMAQEDDFVNRTVEEALVLPTKNALGPSFSSHREEINELVSYYKRNYLDDLLRKDGERRMFSNPYNKSPLKLSGGQRKLVSFISSLIKCRVSKSIFFLLDEPLNNLDRENKMVINDLLNDLRGSNPDLIIILISHCQIFYGINRIMKIRKSDDSFDFLAKIEDYKGRPYECLMDSSKVSKGFYRIRKLH